MHCLGLILKTMSNLPDYPIDPEYVEGGGDLGSFYYLVLGSPHKDVGSYLFSYANHGGGVR